MEEIQNYVFYIVSKEFDFLKSKGYSFGVKRMEGIYNHEKYMEALRNIDSLDMGPIIFENIPNVEWVRQTEMIAQNGNIIIVNSAIEIENIENRLYGIYLPSYPTSYQIQELKKHMQEIEKIHLDIDIHGCLRNNFLERRRQLNNNFIALQFLKVYLIQSQKRLNNVQMIRKLAVPIKKD